MGETKSINRDPRSRCPLISGNYRSCEESFFKLPSPVGLERPRSAPGGAPLRPALPCRPKASRGKTRCPLASLLRNPSATKRRAKPSWRFAGCLSRPRTKPARRETSSSSFRSPRKDPPRGKRPDPGPPSRPLPLTPAGRTWEKQLGSPNDPESQRRAGAPLLSAWLSRT